MMMKTEDEAEAEATPLGGEEEQLVIVSRLQRLPDDWAAKAPDPRRWLLTDALPLGKCGLLAAGGGVGKTTALVQLALAVALGGHKNGTPRTWLGLPVDPTPGRVLLALGEEDAEEVRRRFYTAAQAERLSPAEAERARENLIIVPLAGVGVALVDENGVPSPVHEELAMTLTELKGAPWRLVVLDPLSRFAGGDTETDNAAATRLVQAVEALAQAPNGSIGPTVLVAHHSSKAGVKEGNADVRGSSAIHDGFRWVATLTALRCEADPNTQREALSGALLYNLKSNYSRYFEPVYLTRGDDGVLREATEAERPLLAESRKKIGIAPTDTEAKREALRIRGQRANTESEKAETARAREARLGSAARKGGLRKGGGDPDA